MPFQIRILAFAFLAFGAFAQTNSTIHDLFTSLDIPVISDHDLSILNTTKTAPPGKARYETRAINLQYILYDITMDGRNLGNWEEFLVSGKMLITDGIPASPTENGPNPNEILIAVGSPDVNPIAGSIRFATNRYLYKFIDGNNAIALVDYAYVTTSGSSINVIVDTRLAAANQLSNFNARSGLTADVYLVASGGFSITLGTTTLSGTIDVVGQSYIFYGTAPYKAKISGTVVGRGTMSL